MKSLTNKPATGNRVSKTVVDKNTTGDDKYVTTHYIRDPHGNTLAVYDRKRGEDYRYGFQGQDKEKELWGGEASFFKYRISDNRLGRFFSVDPLSSKFPWNSSYAFSENRVIDGVEMEGLEYINANNEHISCLRNNDDGSYEAWDKRGDLSDTKSAIKESDFGTEIRGGNLKE